MHSAPMLACTDQSSVISFTMPSWLGWQKLDPRRGGSGVGDAEGVAELQAGSGLMQHSA